FLKYLFIGLTSLFLLLLLVVQFFGGSITQSVIKSINSSLVSDIEVGRAELSLLSSFPNLSVNLEDVEVGGSDGSLLLESDKVSCRIGLSSLFGKTHIKRIYIEGGGLHIIIDEDGNPNYLIAGATPVGEEPSQESGTELSIDDARLRNIELIYENKQLDNTSVLNLDWADFSGDFDKSIYQLTSEALAEVKFIESKGSRYLMGTYLKLDAQTLVDTEEDFYQFERFNLGLDLLNLELTGGIRLTDDGMDLDIKFGTEEGRLTDLIRLIPDDYLGPLAQLESRGNWSLTGSVLGPYTERLSPAINANVSFGDGRLSSPMIDARARDIAFEASLTNGDLQRMSSTVLSISDFSGEFDGEPFALQARVENLDDPRLDLVVNGKIALGALPGLLPLDNIAGGRGFLQVQDLQLSGRYEDMLRPRQMGRVNASGRLRLDRAGFEINERPIRLPSGSLTIDDNQMTMRELVVEAPGTVLEFTGEATNLIPVLFADSLNSQDAALEFRAMMVARNLDLDELFQLYGATDEEVEAAEATGQGDSLRRRNVAEQARLTDLLRGRFEVQVDEWNYDKLEGENFTGQLEFDERGMLLRGQTEAMDGNFQLDGRMYFQPNQRISARVTANQVDVTDFFEQSNNFGQEVLTSDNLRGNLDSKMAIEVYFDEAGYIDYDRLHILAGIGIYDGELRNFEMLENFAAFLKTRDLERVRFSQLENYLEIKNGSVSIPTMFIQSSAMNMTISGDHTFENYIDYNIKVNASQVLANKIGRHDSDLSLLRARRNGFFNMYFKIFGPLDTFTYERAKREVKSDFRRSEAHRQAIRESLERRFGTVIQMVEEPTDWLDADESIFEPGTDGEMEFELQGGGGD
ncbi:MAG: AsmA-like C-terminal region-containing protein, partial [Bacteroidota bacterium]